MRIAVCQVPAADLPSLNPYQQIAGGLLAELREWLALRDAVVGF